MPGAERRPSAGLRARLLAIAPVRALLKRRGVERLVALVNRSSVIERGRARFLACELLGREGEALYPVRGAAVPVLVRHGSADVATLDDVFYSLDYAVPAPAAELLGGAPEPLRVLDLGANVGYFGAFVLARFPGAQVTSVEPDPRNLAALRRAVAAAGQGERWRIVEGAAATGPGTVPFVQALYSTAHVARDGEGGATVEVATVDALALIEDADLVKIDIEGSEWPILADPRFAGAGARAVVLEYHPEGCPAADALDEARRILHAAGYATQAGVRHPDGQGVIWAWREPNGAAAGRP